MCTLVTCLPACPCSLGWSEKVGFKKLKWCVENIKTYLSYRTCRVTNASRPHTLATRSQKCVDDNLPVDRVRVVLTRALLAREIPPRARIRWPYWQRRLLPTGCIKSRGCCHLKPPPAAWILWEECLNIVNEQVRATVEWWWFILSICVLYTHTFTVVDFYCSLLR